MQESTTIRTVSRSSSSFIYSVLLRSLVGPLISATIVVVLSGPFYAFQYRHIGDAGYSHPANMSFGGGTLLQSGKGATNAIRNTFVIRGQTSTDLQLFTYRISEVFMTDAGRGKKLWASIHIEQIALFLLIATGFILSFRFTWLWPLHLTAIIHTALWYVYASYAYYDLEPGIVLYVVLSGIGYVKLFELTVGRTTRHSDSPKLSGEKSHI